MKFDWNVFLFQNKNFVNFPIFHYFENGFFNKYYYYHYYCVWKLKGRRRELTSEINKRRDLRGIHITGISRHLSFMFSSRERFIQKKVNNALRN